MLWPGQRFRWQPALQVPPLTIVKAHVPFSFCVLLDQRCAERPCVQAHSKTFLIAAMGNLPEAAKL